MSEGRGEGLFRLDSFNELSTTPHHGGREFTSYESFQSEARHMPLFGKNGAGRLVSKVSSLLVPPVLYLLGLPGVGEGQDVTWPEPGTQVRVFAPASAADTIRGHILDLADSTMVLQSPTGHRLGVEYGDIILLQTPLYGEYERSVLVGAASGAGVLTLLGAAFGGFAGSESTGTAVLTFAAVGALVGGAIGAISGTRSVRGWTTYYPPDARRPDARPACADSRGSARRGPGGGEPAPGRPPLRSASRASRSMNAGTRPSNLASLNSVKSNCVGELQ